MTAVPDAWDECSTCGHDRDDHPYYSDNLVTLYRTGSCGWPGCDCPRFIDVA